MKRVTNATSFVSSISLIEKESFEFLTESLQQGDMERGRREGLDVEWGVRGSSLAALGNAATTMTIGGPVTAIPKAKVHRQQGRALEI